jgi:chromosome segregation ATPase
MENLKIDDDIKDYINCLEGDLRKEAEEIVLALINDRNQAQKARLEARMATTTIKGKIHDIAEARWKILPLAVQREHEILAMDISELQWHVKQETQKMVIAQEKLENASTINTRLKADIDFNKNHSPLVEEKLRLEEAAMVDIKQEQKVQTGVLHVAKSKLKLAQEDFKRKSTKLRQERAQHEEKLEKVCDVLIGLQDELNKKELEADGISDKIASTNIQIEAQEAEIAALREEAAQMRKTERAGIEKMEKLKTEIKKHEVETIALQAEKDNLRAEIYQKHENYKEKLASLKSDHTESVGKLKETTKQRNELRLENEDSKKRQNVAKANIAKLEKEIRRLKADTQAAEKDYHELTIKLVKLEQHNAELVMTIERQEKQYQQIEENLQMSIDKTRNQIDEEIKTKAINEQRLSDDTVTLETQTAFYSVSPPIIN